MSDGSLPLQGAIVAALKGAPALADLVGDRIYDQAPADVIFPYTEYDDGQVIGERADCYEGFELYPTIHVWSRAIGWPEVKRIGGAVHDILHEAELDVPGFGLVDLAFESARYLRDPDGLTRHAVVTFKALLEPAD